MRELPSGTVTFLFTDIEGSTRRWEQDSPAMLTAVERHFSLLDEAIVANHGARFKTIGDAIQAAFPTALDALQATVAAQRALAAADWGALGPITVRMALHTGAATPRDGDYLAPALNRLARLLASAAGGQMVMTEATRNLVRELLPRDIRLRDLGEHSLRDLREAEHVYQIDAEGLPSDFPPLKTVDRPLHNLPADVTAFIGREQEVAEAKHRLEEPGLRLLTLTGPGGTGKTRLALQVAADLVPVYPDGVWFVALAPVASTGRIAAAIAEALGVRESAGEPIEETLRAFLRSRHLLLVLDNFEHLVDAAPQVADLLTTAPGLQILATSRTPLRITGEHELPVQPLELPKDDPELPLDDALASEAVRLFVDRARAVRADFVLTEANVGTVVAICRRLDGLPLAIELAAARIRLLSPEAILSRLDNRLGLLTGGGRDRPERQQTLRAAIAWSHDLLGPEDQALFRRLAVFVGGWTLEAAETIANSVEDSDLSVLDGLETLNDNSLIRLNESAGNRLADPRFDMLQTIHEFAQAQLATSGEVAPLKDAHAAYFLTLAGEAAPHLTGPDAVSWLDRLDADYDNLRAAL
ncbi:MAG: ATP-binding protein, partial [Thermomicrobiales bacterium]